MDLTRPIRLATALGIVFSMAAFTSMYNSTFETQSEVRSAEVAPIACNAEGRITVAGRPDCVTVEEN